MKKWIFLTSILIFLVNFPLHFLYDIFPNFLTSIISPVNESIFEHMKMLFTSFILSGIIVYFISKKKSIWNYLFSFSLSGLICIAIFLIFYVPFIIFFKENMIITFIILYLSILITQIVCYYILFFSKIKYQNFIFLGILLIFYSISTYLTYNPPHFKFFYDPKNNGYGLNIKKEK